MTNPIHLLSRLRADTREDFAKAGIRNLEQIVAMDPQDLRKFRGIKSTANAVHAHARAWVEKRAVWYGKLEEFCLANAAHFDIETRPNEYGETEVWSIGWCCSDAALKVVIVAEVNRVTALALPNQQNITLVPDAETAWRVFAEGVAGIDCPIFHWTGYDAGVMRKTAPGEVTQQLGSRLHDLCKLFDDAVKLPVKGVSLKPVARHLGFEWHGYDDWFAAYLDYNRWLRTGNLHALASACAYQCDDVAAMVIVQNWLIENAPEF
jgi:predicted RecB family nuclease